MKNRFTEEQIIKVLKEHEGGRPAIDTIERNILVIVFIHNFGFVRIINGFFY